MTITYTESALCSQQAQEAMGEGLATWIITGDVQQGWNAMIRKGKQNGSYLGVKIAIFVDFLIALSSKR